MQNFCAKYKEKSDFNQFWYSERTIGALVVELRRLMPSRVACLSTPSIYFTCIAEEFACDLFDFDETLLSKSDAGERKNVFKYDFHYPEVALDLRGVFDIVVCDPPFITPDVIGMYSITISQLLRKGGKIIFSSTSENWNILREMVDPSMSPALFRPSIPTLVYQYKFYVNYNLDSGSLLAQNNPEVDEIA
jgi:hypothetical protein